MKWFARGKLWDSPEQSQWAGRNARDIRKAGPPRDREWRPGGEHKDPRARFDKHKKKHRPHGDRPARRPRSSARAGEAESPRRPRHATVRAKPRPPRGDRPWQDKSAPPRGDRPWRQARHRPWSATAVRLAQGRQDRGRTGPVARRAAIGRGQANPRAIGRGRTRPAALAPPGRAIAPVVRGNRRGDRPWSGKPAGAQAIGRGSDPSTPAGSDRPLGPPKGDRPWANKAGGPPRGDRPWSGKPPGDRPWSGKPALRAIEPRQDKPARPTERRSAVARPTGRRTSQGNRPWTGKPAGGPPRGDRPMVRQAFRLRQAASRTQGGGSLRPAEATPIAATLAPRTATGTPPARSEAARRRGRSRPNAAAAGDSASSATSSRQGALSPPAGVRACWLRRTTGVTPGAALPSRRRGLLCVRRAPTRSPTMPAASSAPGLRPFEPSDVRPGPTAIVVLGSGSFTARDWTGNQFSVVDPAAATRVLEAVRVFKLIDQAWVISSGGRVDPDDPDEPTGQTMRDALVQLGCARHAHRRGDEVDETRTTRRSSLRRC